MYCSTKTGDPGHSKPDLIDHLLPVLDICYHEVYIFELQSGME